MQRLLSLRAWLSTTTLAATLLTGCTDPSLTDNERPTIERTVVQTTPRIVDIVQGETFTIEAWREWSDGSRSAPDVEVFSLPAGLVLLGRSQTGTLTSLVIRGVEPLDFVLTLTDNSIPMEDGLPVVVRPAGTAVLPSAAVWDDEGTTVVVLIPDERGQPFTFGAIATNDLGCPVPGGANVLTVETSGDVGAFTISPPVRGRAVSQPGCAEAADAALDVGFTIDEALELFVNIDWDVAGPAGRGTQLKIATLGDRYIPETASSGLPALGTIIRQSTTCGAFQPGTFDFSALLQYDETNGLRIVNPDGSAFQGTEAPLGAWTFTSPQRSLGNGLSVQETISTGDVGYRRETDGGISAVWDGTSRIDYFQVATGTKICDETARHVAAARIPRFGFRFIF